MNKKIKLMMTFISAISLSWPAHAASPGIFGGVGLDYSYLADFDGTTQYGPSWTQGQRFFIGYNYSATIGFEAAYTQYGHTNYTVKASSDMNVDYRLKSLTGVVKAYVPLGSFDVYGILGFAEMYGVGDTRIGSTKLSSSSEQGMVSTAGLGASYLFTSYLVTSLEFIRTGKKGSNVNSGIPNTKMFSLNVALVI
ncbi:MAG: outer membrane beta-barrel protein [Gammaproteobacteria bacterium]|nr:outer membrane beta-barrel protein [Gammaproteobacteria bacterium]